jgi:hypothetical protein
MHLRSYAGEAKRRAEVVAKSSVLFEEFVAPQTSRLPLAPGPNTILLHGHCHQKSMSLLAPAKALLSSIPGATVVDLDAGCCGMAGSFGYAREHYDVSRAIGERKLFPLCATSRPARSSWPAAPVAVIRIADFTGESAYIPAVLLAHLLRRTRRTRYESGLALPRRARGRDDHQLLQSAERRRARPGAGVDSRRVPRRHEARRRDERLSRRRRF